MYLDDIKDEIRESFFYVIASEDNTEEDIEDPIEEYIRHRMSHEQGTLAFYGLSWRDFY